jgi:hypothetical protein
MYSKAVEMKPKLILDSTTLYSETNEKETFPNSSQEIFCQIS